MTSQLMVFCILSNRVHPQNERALALAEMTSSDKFMISLIRKLCTDEVGSSMSAEMALVTSLTIGALVMTMSQFSASVNREFQKSAAQTGLTISDLEKEKDDEDKPVQKKEKESDDEQDQ